jgi:hypothetical protein
MEKLSDVQKLKVLERVVNMLETGSWTFICSAILAATNELFPQIETYGIESSTIRAISLIPEMEKIKPPNLTILNSVWFGDSTMKNQERRIEAVKKMIDLIISNSQLLIRNSDRIDFLQRYLADYDKKNMRYKYLCYGIRSTIVHYFSLMKVNIMGDDEDRIMITKFAKIAGATIDGKYVNSNEYIICKYFPEMEKYRPFNMTEDKGNRSGWFGYPDIFFNNIRRKRILRKLIKDIKNTYTPGYILTEEKSEEIYSKIKTKWDKRRNKSIIYNIKKLFYNMRRKIK